jgi:hypothetical protein
MPAFPSTLFPDRIKATRRRAQAVASSPFSLSTQVFDWGAARWEITVTMPEMVAEDAAIFGAWIESLGGMVGTFTLNLTPWVPGLDPAPGVRTFRLAAPVNLWEGDRAHIWAGFQFDAVEVV